jgi:hypothetical protein
MAIITTSVDNGTVPEVTLQVLDNLHRHDIELSFSLVGNKLRDRRYEVATPTIDAVLALVQERGPQAGLSGNDAPKIRREVSVLAIRPLLGERTGQQGTIGWQGRGS